MTMITLDTAYANYTDALNETNAVLIQFDTQSTGRPFRVKAEGALSGLTNYYWTVGEAVAASQYILASRKVEDSLDLEFVAEC